LSCVSPRFLSCTCAPFAHPGNGGTGNLFLLLAFFFPCLPGRYGQGVEPVSSPPTSCFFSHYFSFCASRNAFLVQLFVVEHPAFFHFLFTLFPPFFFPLRGVLLFFPFSLRLPGKSRPCFSAFYPQIALALGVSAAARFFSIYGAVEAPDLFSLQVCDLFSQVSPRLLSFFTSKNSLGIFVHGFKVAYFFSLGSPLGGSCTPFLRDSFLNLPFHFPEFFPSCSPPCH